MALGWLPEGALEEELLLLVERQPGPGDDAALAEACREAVLATVGVAAGRVEVVAPGALPTTSSGKLRRREALRRYLAGELGGAAAARAAGAGA